MSAANRDFIWVIKNSKGNFTYENSIERWDAKTWIYMSYKTFSPECRGYSELQQAKLGLDELRFKAQKMGLNESFHLECVDIDKVVGSKAIDDNMVLIKKQVA